jgi:hypothetical protein
MISFQYRPVSDADVIQGAHGTHHIPKTHQERRSSWNGFVALVIGLALIQHRLPLNRAGRKSARGYGVVVSLVWTALLFTPAHWSSGACTLQPNRARSCAVRLPRHRRIRGLRGPIRFTPTQDSLRARNLNSERLKVNDKR